MTDNKDEVKHVVMMTVYESGRLEFQFKGAETLGVGKMERMLYKANRHLRAEHTKIRRASAAKAVIDKAIQDKVKKADDKIKADAKQVADIVVKNPDIADKIKDQVDVELNKARAAAKDNQD